MVILLHFNIVHKNLRVYTAVHHIYHFLLLSSEEDRDYLNVEPLHSELEVQFLCVFLSSSSSANANTDYTNIVLQVVKNEL